MTAIARYLSAPGRTLQISIWVMLAAVLALIVPMSATATPTTSTVAVAQVQNAQAADDQVLAYANVPPVDSSALTYDNPTALLPAYRWSSALALPSDLGVAELGPGGFLTQIASMLFTIAGLVWWLLLMLMKLSLSMDLVTTFAGSINTVFASMYDGMFSSGLVWIIAVAAFLAAAMAAARGKLNEGIKTVVSCLLVLGLLQSLGSAAAADTTSAAGDNASTTYTAAKGTPAWLALQGNMYANDISSQLYTVFGATASITNGATSGSAGLSDEGSGGATCAYYMQRLYATYNDQASSSQAAPALTMVSFLWQRSVYDNYTQAAFAVNPDGARIACHQLENSAGVTPSQQRAIAGSDVAGSPYSGMGEGPFLQVGSTKEKQAATLAWAVCESDGKARSGWNELVHFSSTAQADEACTQWWSDADGRGLGDVAGSDTLGWKSLAAVDRDTVGENGDADDPRMHEIQDVMYAYYGHNGPQRLISGVMALTTSGLYAWAFGGPAVGVMLSQFLLIFMMLILPWTLLMLAIPGKNGARGAVGKKMLKMTAMSFGGKMLFLVIMGVTLTMMSTLFNLLMSSTQSSSAADTQVLAAGLSGWASGWSSVWGLIIPVVSIVAMKYLLKGMGMGNLMGLSGTLGFATAAVKQGTSGKMSFDASRMPQGGITGGAVKAGKSVGKSVNKLTAKAAASGRSTALGAARGAVNGERTRRLLAATRLDKDGQTVRPFLDQDLKKQLVEGRITAWSAARQQRARNNAGAPTEAGQLPAHLARAVADRRLSLSQAQGLHAAEIDYERTDAQARAQERAQLEASKQSPIDAAAARLSVEAAHAESSVPVHAHLDTIDAQQAFARLESARVDLPVIASGAADGVQWQTVHQERLSGEYERLLTSTRLDASTTPLNLDQTVAALAQARALVPEPLQSQVVMGSGGAPAMLASQLTAEGHLQLPAGVTITPEVALAVLGNTTNLLDPSVTSRRATESEDAWHTRVTLAKLDTGLLTPDGHEVDTLPLLGIDRAKANWQEEAVKLLADMQSRGAEEFVANLRTIGTVQQRRIEGTAYQVTDRAAAPDMVSSPQLRQGEATRVATNNSVHELADLVTRMSDLAGQLDISIVDKKEAGKIVSSLFNQLENTAPNVAGQALARRLEAQVASARLGGASTDAVEAQVRALSTQLNDELAALRNDVSRGIIDAKLAGDDSNVDEIVRLVGSVVDNLRQIASDNEKASGELARAITTNRQGVEEAMSGQLRQMRAEHRAAPPVS